MTPEEIIRVRMARGGSGVMVTHSTHVVVDTKDGYVFWRDSDGILLGEQSAKAFADSRNDEMKSEHRSYRVFALTETKQSADEFWECRACRTKLPVGVTYIDHAEYCTGFRRKEKRK